MAIEERFHGPNLAYLLEVYARYRQDPLALPETERRLIAHLEAEGELTPSLLEAPAEAVAPGAPQPAAGDVRAVVAAARLARNIREYGHLAARLDPLGGDPPGDPALDPAFHGIDRSVLARLPAEVVRPAVPGGGRTCLEAVDRLREVYCGYIGYDFSHVHAFEEREWLRETVESASLAGRPTPQQRRELLARLSEVEAFERFLHQTFTGQKRFSIEGCDMLVPMLDEVVAEAVAVGTRAVVIGMAHRGRLNVLAHVLGKPYAAIFSEFHSGSEPLDEVDTSQGWTGDVKYHLGGHRTLHNGHLAEVEITLANNPSHLEFVNPVVAGITRAAQEDRGEGGAPVQDPDRALAVTIHGDASFPGEGVVAETLNLSRLPGYRVGGTLHLIVNNQLGFTTGPQEGRSTLYASDLAKGFEIPILHVNADQPEACLTAVRIACAYRRRFRKDVLVDLVGYRRWGHNEGDEPSFTQPLMYRTIAEHPTVRELYARTLVAEGVVTQEEAEAMVAQVMERLRRAREEAAPAPEPGPAPEGEAEGRSDTAVEADRLRRLNGELLERPEGFHPHPRLERLLQRRRESLERPAGIDWAHAESLAFATLLEDGVAIRLAGQDTERGTFSQRHLVLHDVENGARFTPLQALASARAAFAVYNSPLSEAAALGFEYGYSLDAPRTLVLWEAQFGDFANAAQVLIDQFLASGRAKWRERSGLVLLLPHGYEGQGPEHSSARLERFLQLAAEENLIVANCTTAAQYFHLLRRQAARLDRDPVPLVLMTPKSLLRHPLAASSLADLAEGAFAAVLDDPAAQARRASVRRLVLTSGKVAVDYLGAAAAAPEAAAAQALIRLEQLYPFPAEALARVVAGYPAAEEAIWLQEEPENMGAWRFVAPQLGELLPAGVPLRYVGPPPRAAAAEGSPTAHAAQQQRILREALALPAAVELQGRGGARHGG